MFFLRMSTVFLDRVIVLVGAKHVDEAESVEGLLTAPFSLVIGLSLSVSLLVTNVLEKVLERDMTVMSNRVVPTEK
jgi:hypothetical protein